MPLYNIDGNQIGEVFDVEGGEVYAAYDIDGNVVRAPLPLDYSTYTTTDLFTYPANNFDAFDVYDGIIFQIMASDKLYLFDLDTHETIASAMPIMASHGDSASFSREKYQESDAFPLFYITSNLNPALVYVNRITMNSATLVKTLIFPLDKAGYYAAHAYDEKNQIMYMLGYLEQNTQSDDGGNNKVVVSKWDMSEQTQDGSGRFMPTFISRYFRDFIYVMQGQQFFDGLIWIASGLNDGQAQHIYAMNPTSGEIEHTITLDDNIEIEGLAWVYDEQENKYWMLIGQQNGAAGINYSRIDFATLEA